MRRRYSFDEDRLSSLSDHLLHKILSLLPSKDAASTCILSRRWRDLWNTIPDLCFDELHFLELYYRYPHSQSLSSPEFVKFVDRALLGRKPGAPIRTFHLSSNFAACETDHVDAWLHHVINHSPSIQEIRLEICFSGNFKLPLPNYLVSLRKLYFRGCIMTHFIWPETMRLPSLTHLSLTSLAFGNGFRKDSICRCCPALKKLKLVACEAVEGLDIIGCPLLEKLILRWTRITELNVQSPMLSWLVIDDCFRTCPQKTIRLNAPNLQRIMWKGVRVNAIAESSSLPCLNIADLDFSTLQFATLEGSDYNGGDGIRIACGMNSSGLCKEQLCVGRLFVKLANVNHLILRSASPVQCLCAHIKNDVSESYAFANIQHLSIQLSYSNRLDHFLSLLVQSPNIQALTVQAGPSDEYYFMGRYWEEDHMGLSDEFDTTIEELLNSRRHGETLPLSKLSEVKFENFRGAAIEIGLLKFLLRCANILAKVYIKFFEDVPQNEREIHTDRILKLHIVSSKCHVFIY